MPSAASRSELEGLSMSARSSSSFGCVSKKREVLNEMRSIVECVCGGYPSKWRVENGRGVDGDAE